MPKKTPAPSASAVAPMPATPEDWQRQRQVVHWRTLGAMFGLNEQAENLDGMAREVVKNLDLPNAILDPVMAVETLLQRYPELKVDFDALEAGQAAAEESATKLPAITGTPPLHHSTTPVPLDPRPSTLGSALVTPDSLRREVVYSKLLLNVFGPNTLAPTLTAEQYRQWQQESCRLGACLGLKPGGSSGAPSGQPGLSGPAGQSGGGVSGRGPGGMVNEEQLKTALTELESDLIKRIALREILKDDTLSAQLPCSMPVIEQLLLDKGNLSGNALKNAKLLIKKYVDQLAEAMKKQVLRAAKGKIDRSVPPKRVFRNLDLKRTLWKNLVNYNPDDGRLHVNQLYYRQTASKVLPKRLIIVVDQSGSMVDAMVQTAILSSIFATLPKVDVHLIAFDTNVIDLTPWVREPFETLMRTNLGGGTDGPKAMLVARERIGEPRNTTMVWISDFEDSQSLLEMIKQVKESGVRFIPVGALKSGYFSVNQWFRDKLKQLGTPILSGTVEKLIAQLRDLL